jgi:hypothetical protein
VPTTLPCCSPSVRGRSGRTPLTVGALGALLLAAVALAAPAAALEDPRRPVAEVTHGPSCGPGVVRVEVTNGNQPHQVALVFDGTVVQEVADLAPGEQAELGSADVDWGTTVHVTVTMADAQGAAQLPLDFGTYTRPSKADCDALVPLTEPEPGVVAPDTVTSALPKSPPAPASGSKAPAPLPPMGAGGTSPVPGAGETVPRALPVGDQAPGASPGVAVAAPVAPGGVVTVRGSGFTPGEQVDVTLDGVAAPLATVVAAADGTVEAVVQIPRGADLGSVTVQLVGRTSSAMSGLDLQVAARQLSLAESSAPVPVLAAGTALLVASVGLGVAASRRPRTAPAAAHSHAAAHAWRR